MTSESSDMNDRDAAVRRSYRQFSDETTPTGLDDRILAEARRAARPRYVMPFRWMRPLAWAATIVLTVSVILHMTELPSPADIEPPAGDRDRLLDESAADRPDRATEFSAAPASEPAARPIELEETRPAPAAAERRERSAATEASANAAASKASESLEAVTRALPESDMLRSASDLARQQDSGSETTAATAALAIRPMAAELPPDTCTEAERRSADSWFACIKRLRAGAFEESAAEEMEALRQAFPDFDIP